MPIKKYKPTSPGRRGMTGDTFEDITRTKPERSLLTDKRKKAGRNAYGKITVRHRGGGVKQAYRIIDFKRDKHDVPARVASIEYDPNRTARIALLFYADGEKRYIIAPVELKVGDTVVSGPTAEVRAGQLPAAGEHAARHDGAQRRAAARQGRPDGALGGHVGAAAGEGRRLRHLASAVR